MHMLGWMRGKSKKYRIKDEEIRERLRVVLIKDKMKDGRLEWFGL